jgi:RecJ-like exonuclease
MSKPCSYCNQTGKITDKDVLVKHYQFLNKPLSVMNCPMCCGTGTIDDELNREEINRTTQEYIENHIEEDRKESVMEDWVEFLDECKRGLWD